MARNKDKRSKEPTDEEVEALFATVDETGHSNPPAAEKERTHRRKHGVGVQIDPLSGMDPSGSNVGQVIARTAVIFVVVILVAIVAAQIFFGLARRASTANLSQSVSVSSVASALRGGVEWGGGFTQFPEDFSVQEADESTGRVEVTVTDTSSENELEAFAGSQIQASALSVNALLNPNINTVIYHVNVHVGDDGKLQTSALFGFLQPTGDLKPFMTFIWTKSVSPNGGFNFFCTITGLDEQTTEALRDKISVEPMELFGSANDSEGQTSATATDQQNTVPGQAQATGSAQGDDTNQADGSAQDKGADPVNDGDETGTEAQTEG